MRTLQGSDPAMQSCLAQAWRVDNQPILWQDDAMRRREDNRSIATQVMQAVARVLFITALGMGLASLFGDIGIPTRALGVLGALAVSGTAVLVSDYAAAAERRRCEEERRSIELEDRKVEEFVAYMAAESLSVDMAPKQPTELESRFVQLVDEQRQHAVNGERGHLR